MVERPSDWDKDHEAVLVLYNMYQDGFTNFDVARNAVNLRAINILAGSLGVDMDRIKHKWKEYRVDTCRSIGNNIKPHHPGESFVSSETTASLSLAHS